MLNTKQAIAAATLCALFASVACTVVTPGDGAGGAATSSSGGASSQSGQGGQASQGGQTNHGGQVNHGGQPGQGGRGGSSAVQAGAAGIGATAGTSGANTGGTGAAGGTGGGAGGPAQCPSCASGFCFLDGTCVDCLPSQDNCPAGQVCGSNNTCIPGCKEDGTSCASGVCADTHDCQSCMGDDECGAGHVCGDNQCALACSAAEEGTNAGCGTGLTCCGLHCIAEETDSRNCGACGTACGQGQFCGRQACAETGAAGAGGAGSGWCSACNDTILANICAIAKVAVVLDGQDGNETPGRAIGAALVANCNPAPALREVLQTVPDALNPASGRPVSGAHELLVAAGGSFFARLLGYLDSQRVSPIYWHYDQLQTIEFRKSATDEVVVTRQTTEPNDAHDYFVIQFMREPISGSLVLNAEGFWESGTLAATYFFANGVLPNIANFDSSWYVYDWTDQDGDLAPDLDEMTLVASGS